MYSGHPWHFRDESPASSSLRGPPMHSVAPPRQRPAAAQAATAAHRRALSGDWDTRLFRAWGPPRVAVLATPERVALAHVGDSRAYLDPSTHGRAFAGRRPVAPPTDLRGGCEDASASSRVDACARGWDDRRAGPGRTQAVSRSHLRALFGRPEHASARLRDPGACLARGEAREGLRWARCRCKSARGHRQRHRRARSLRMRLSGRSYP